MVDRFGCLMVIAVVVVVVVVVVRTDEVDVELLGAWWGWGTEGGRRGSINTEYVLGGTLILYYSLQLHA